MRELQRTMSVDFNDIVKQGYVRMKSKNLGVWQKRWVILRRASSKGPRRLEKYMDERTASHVSFHKMIELTDVKNVSRLPSDIRKYAIAIFFKDNTSRQFACESDLESDEWMKSLNEECLGKPSSIRHGEPDLLDSGWQREMNERFHVYLMPNPALDMYGECLLQVTAENIHLWDVNNPKKKLVTWSLNSLRRYGRDSLKFTFEAGRYCDTGEGIFVFSTSEGENIYTKVHQAALTIAEAHNRKMQKLNELKAAKLAQYKAKRRSRSRTPDAPQPRVPVSNAHLNPAGGQGLPDNIQHRQLEYDYSLNNNPPEYQGIPDLSQIDNRQPSPNLNGASYNGYRERPRSRNENVDSYSHDRTDFTAEWVLSSSPSTASNFRHYLESRMES
ncbi:docking protein 5-like isoform X2 [Lineus longissimus]|uniref:docking protein 5-like isoform X2 n=1 Tax=Lineus longissimus TaxID=88925 RepID=UPI002B4DD0CF